MSEGIQLSIESFYEEEGVIYYVVSLSFEQTMWKVRRRFKQIASLHDTLSQKIAQLPTLPSKTLWRKKDPAWIESRKGILEDYCRELVVRTDTLNSEEVRFIFEIDQHIPDKALHSPLFLNEEVMSLSVIHSQKFDGGMFFALSETSVLGRIDSFFTNIKLPWERDQGNIQPNGAIVYWRPVRGEWRLVTVWTCSFAEMVTCMHFNEEKGVLTAGRTDGLISLLHITEPYTAYQVVREFNVPNKARVLSAVLESTQLYVIDSNKRFTIIDVNSSQQVAAVQMGKVPSAVDIRMPLAQAFVGFEDGSVEIWDCSCTPPQMIQGLQTTNKSKIMAITVDLILGYVFVGCNDGAVEILVKETENGQSNLKQRFIGHSQITAITWSKSTQEIITGDKNGSIAIWSNSSLRPVYVLKAHNGEIRSLNWLEDEKIMISGGTDKSYKVWRFPEIWTGELGEVAPSFSGEMEEVKLDI